MQLIGLILLFAALMMVQGLVVTEAFYTSPGTQIQMNASHPVYFVAAAPEYVAEQPSIPLWAPFRSYWLSIAR